MVGWIKYTLMYLDKKKCLDLEKSGIVMGPKPCVILYVFKQTWFLIHTTFEKSCYSGSRRVTRVNTLLINISQGEFRQ